MTLPHKLLARSVVLLLLLGMLPALQQPATVVAQDTATYNVTKLDCAPGYDPGSGDASAAFASCTTPSGGVSFSLSSGDGSYGDTQSTDGSGSIAWSGIPLGVGYSVSESIPTGYGVPWVYCEVSGNPNNPGDVQRSFFQAPGGAMDVGYTDPSLTAYTQANCTWFNTVPSNGQAQLQQEGGDTPPPAGATTITIKKQLCGFQYRYQFQTASLADLQSNCPGNQSDAEFTLGGDPNTLTFPDSNGIVVFNGVPTGNVTVREEAYVGVDSARVYCRVHPVTDTSVTYSDADETAAQDGGDDTSSVTLSVTEGNTVDCLWFNVLVTESDRASVIITKYSCPDGTTVPEGTLEEIDDVCATPVANPEFRFLASLDLTVQGDATGTAVTLNLIPGSWSITQTEPVGYTTGRVFCQETNTGGGQLDPAAATEFPVTNANQIQIELQAGYEYLCSWIDTTSTTAPDTETEETGTVLLSKFNCPSGFDWENGEYDYLASGCTDPGAGVNFQLRALNYQNPQTTDSSGAASWDDAPIGSVTLFEQVPTGYKIGRIFCGVSSNAATEPAAWDEVTYEGGLDLEIVGGQVLFCAVFDVPVGYGTIVVHKYECPSDFDWQSGGYPELIAGCTTPHEGVTFDATSHAPNNFEEPKTTGSEGTATWEEVPEGGISIREQESADYSLARVFCGTVGQNSDTLPSTWEEYQHTPEIDTSVPPGEYLHCAFFNVSVEELENGAGYPITITKYTCENFLTRGSPERADFEEHCTEWAEGVDFTLYAGMAIADTTTTDSSGVAVLTAPATGQYQIAETPVDGYLTGAVYCMSSATDDPSQPETLPLLVDVTADYPVTCVWYNASDIWSDIVQDPGAIVIHKFNCPPGYPSDGTVGFENMREDCSLPASDISFSVNQGGNQVASGVTDTTGDVALEGAAIGATRISELPIEGWDPPRVFCANVPVGIGRTLVEYTEQTVTTWGIDYDIPADTWLDCYWFDRLPYAGTDGEPIQIIVHKIVCDPGIDEPGDTYAGASTECVTPEEGVNFDLVGGDGGTSGGPTDANGYAEYNGVAPGSITITETPREGYRTGEVFCSLTYGTTSTGPDRYPVVDEAIQAYVAPGYTLECFWYNIQEPETGHVYVFKYACPEGTTYSSYDDLTANCTEKQAGVTFTLSNPAVPDPYTAVSDAGGLAAMYEVLAGDWTLTETVPAGYQPYAVYCGESDVAYIPPATVESEAIDAAGPSVEFDVHHDTYRMCYWFNIESHEDPQVWLYKYNCPDDADWHWSYHQLLSHCTAPAPDVEFGYGPQGSGQSASMTDDQGRWLYDSLTPGVWYWEEHFPTGYSGVVVYCQWVDPHGSGEFQKAELDGATLWLELEYDQVVTCYWFDFPDGHAPPSPTPHSGGSNGSGDSGGSGGSAGTGESGGSGSAGGGTGGPPPLTSNIPTGPVGGAPQGGTTSQPSDPNAPATLIITRFTCPDGYDIYAEESDVERDCDEQTEGIEFALTDLNALAEAEEDEDVLPDIQLTDADGEATWSDLAAGPYLLVETMPEDTREAFIWTCESDAREFQIEYPLTPFSYAGPAGQVGITLVGGETLECAWFDVPVAPGTVTVYLFDCPASPVIVAQCTPAAAGVELALGPVDAVGPAIELTTDEQGMATGQGAGSYVLMPFDGTPCLMDSDAFDDGGALLLGDGEEVELRIYSCGSGS